MGVLSSKCPLLLVTVLLSSALLGLFHAENKEYNSWIIDGKYHTNRDFKPNNSFFANKSFHIVQHAHDDPGWIYTTASSEHMFQDQMDNIVRFYTNNPDANTTFTYSDIFFLPRYFNTTTREQNLKKLVDRGSIEMVNCAFSMPDQALTHYDDLIGVYEYGREYCKTHLGKLPRISWSIDSFGFSSYFSRLMAEMGYHTQIHNRVDNYEQVKFKRQKVLTHKWKGFRPEEDHVTIFAHQHYTTTIDSGSVAPVNLIHNQFFLLHRMFHAVSIMNEMASDTVGDHVLVFAGDDWFWRDYAKDQKEYKAAYYVMNSNNKGYFNGSRFWSSTVQSYIDEQSKALGKKPAARGPGDMIPLKDRAMDSQNVVWSGYFGSKVMMKHMSRYFGKAIRVVGHLRARQLVAKSVSTLKNLQQDTQTLVFPRRIQGLLCHHDSITGTSSFAVLEDYLKYSDKATTQLEDYLRGILDLDKKPLLPLGLPWNEPYLSESNPIKQVLLTQDSSIKFQRTWVRVGSLDVLETHDIVISDLDDSNSVSIAEVVTALCNKIIVGCRVLVQLDEKISTLLSRSNVVSIQLKLEAKKQVSKIYNQKIELESRMIYKVGGESITVDVSDGLLNLEIAGKSRNVSLGFYMHVSAVPERMRKFAIRTGHYTMRTFFKEPTLQKFDAISVLKTNSGLTISLIYNIKSYPYIAIQVLIDPKKLNSPYTVFTSFDKLQVSFNAEYVLRFAFKSVNEATTRFVTDSNGMNSMNRIYDSKKEIEHSYYPISSFVSVPTVDGWASVFCDRSTGATSPKSGVAEVMFQRNSVGTDGLGVNEYVQDINYAHSRYDVVFDKSSDRPNLRKVQIEDDIQPMQLYLDQQEAKIPNISIKKSENTTHIINELPDTARVQLDIREDGIMARLYNLHESQDWTIPDIEYFLRTRYSVSSACSIEERSVDYNRPLKDVLEQDGPWGVNAAMVRRHSETTEGRRITVIPISYRTYKISCT